MNRLPLIAALIAAIGFVVYSSVFVVNEREQAIVLRFGEIRRVITEPGLYVKVPTNFVDSVQFIEDRLLRFDLEDIRIQVRDGRWYLVDAFIAYKINDAARFRRSVGGVLARAEMNLRTQLDASLRRVYGRRSFEAALSEQRAEMMLEVRDQLRPNAQSLGIEIVDVRIRRTDLTQEVSAQTFERMRAERLAEAAELRARGTQEALRIRAEADRQAVVLVAEAQRDADIMRGEGDAERNRVFAEVYGKDVEFFSFYRSLTAYEKATEANDTTMVLSPDSDFFRYFANPEGSAGAPPVSAAQQ